MQLDSFESRLWKCRCTSYVLRFCLFIFPINSRVLLTFGLDINGFPTVRFSLENVVCFFMGQVDPYSKFLFMGYAMRISIKLPGFLSFFDFDQTPGICRHYDLDRSLNITELHIRQVPGSELGTEITHVSRDIKIRSPPHQFLYCRASSTNIATRLWTERLRTRSSIPGTAKRFLSFPQHLDRL